MVWREGDLIRKLRLSTGWTLNQLHRQSGVGITAIHRIEVHRTKEPKRDTIRKLATAFGLTPREFEDAIPKQSLTITPKGINPVAAETTQSLRGAFRRDPATKSGRVASGR